MSDERISNLAAEFKREGHLAVATVLYFVAGLYLMNDKIGIAILACFAEQLCAKRLPTTDRASEESKAIAEMMREL